jgi:hypothetical protein
MAWWGFTGRIVVGDFGLLLGRLLHIVDILDLSLDRERGIFGRHFE